MQPFRAFRTRVRTGVRARVCRAVARTAALGVVVVGGGAGCHMLSTEAPGALVPPTADQDRALPQLTVTVAGHARALHLQRVGDPAHPPLFVLPGGPGADYRLLLPLAALADRYHVVLWDPRGAGLSERVGMDELTIDSFDAEIAAVHAAVAPGRPAVLVGHSFGALFATRYAARHPGAVARLVLVEPGGLTGPARRADGGGALAFAAVEDFLWQNELLASSDHAAADYKAVHLVREASRSYTCDGRRPPEDPTWRFGALHHHALTHSRQAPEAAFDFAAGLGAFSGGVLVVAGTCGAGRADYQRAHNLASLPGARLVTIPGAGHISLFTEYAAPTLAAVRAFLGAPPPTGAPGRPGPGTPGRGAP